MMTFLYILLFIFFLSILIVVHELGHFAMCKAFKVYVFEFSIGMGPALFKFKRKGAETQYSLRAIPFGGYVSMYDSDETLPEGHDPIDASRSMEKAKVWKRAIIMVAGVTMNIVLAFVMYFAASWIPQKKLYYNYVQGVPGITESTIYNAKMYSGSVVGIDEHAIVHFNDDTVKNDVIAAMDLGNVSLAKTNINEYLNFYYPVTQEGTDSNGNPITVTTISATEVVDISKVSYVEFKFDCLDTDATKENKAETYGKYVDIRVDSVFDSEKQKYSYSDTGVSFSIEIKKPKHLGDALNMTCAKFGRGSTIVITSFGQLFTKPAETISQSGGIIAIGFESTKVLQNYGWSYFIELWAMISVNLAIINIFPFPGLDGWHLVVLAYETISRKKMPTKVKNVVALIGLAILFLLMILLVFKDAFRYIF